MNLARKMSQNLHKSVLLTEVIAGLNAQKPGLYIDATFGAGGYSKAILAANEENQVVAFDRDEQVKKFALKIQETYGNRLSFINQKFSQLEVNLQKRNINLIDGLVLDLGVSSMQLDTGQRGFSFNKEGMLNMQMGLNEVSAYEIVNYTPEEELANIIFQYGEETQSRRIAKQICIAREKKNIETTLELAHIVEKAKSFNRKSKIHPATKTFQAIRIHVNEELQELKTILLATLKLLKSGGKLVVVSFHGLEDKIVKNFMKDHAGKVSNNRYLPAAENYIAELKILTNGVKPTLEEIQYNPRSRSAIMRVAEKI